jgi:hypothetical protein
VEKSGTMEAPDRYGHYCDPMRIYAVPVELRIEGGKAVVEATYPGA